MDNILYGKYQHYKNHKFYEVVGIARHSETQEEMIIYRALHHCEKYGLNQIWVRPKRMFFEYVEYDGKSLPRFKWVEK
jgi:hypothetical protein